MRQIKFYRTQSGDCPIEKFLDSLPSKQAQKTTWVLRLIEELEIVPVKFFKKSINTADIWEVRIQVGNNIIRLLGFKDGNNIIVLNHGFYKKTQKTPKKDIQLAQVRKKDYLTKR